MERNSEDLVPEWYRELRVEFADGSVEVFHIERKPTGTHIPLLRSRPAPWTELGFEKCPHCPWPGAVGRCGAAVSLQTTLSKLRDRTSMERVKATAVDARDRAQTVEWPLQDVGSTFVQLAVFASDCPVGRKFKPYLQGLPPFVTSVEFSRHMLGRILEEHKGSAENARREVAETVEQLHEVFIYLMRRLRGGGEPPGKDAIPNSITQLDALSQLLALKADMLCGQLSSQLGWDAAPPPPEKGFLGKLWDRLT